LVIGGTALDGEIHQALQARFEYVQQQRLTMPFKYALPKRRAQAREHELGCNRNRFSVGRCRWRVSRFKQRSLLAIVIALRTSSTIQFVGIENPAFGEFARSE
jgi:hypothetical protein